MNLLNLIINFILSLFKKQQVEETKPEPIIPNDEQSQIGEQDWIVESFVQDQDNALQVVYREKYGDEKTVFCKVVFRNDKTRQYKLVSPWTKTFLITMENITSLDVSEVPYSKQ